MGFHIDDGVLAGSDLDMAGPVGNATRWLGVDVAEAVRMASLYAADAIGLAGELGRIKAGYRADLAFIDTDFNVLGTWITGKPVDAAEIDYADETT